MSFVREAHTTSIMIVDDHSMVRESIAKIIDECAAFQVVAQAQSASAALTLAIDKRPEIVLMDIDMPGMIPFDAAREISRHVPEVKIVFLSGYCRDHYIEQALAVKARGYLMKTESSSSLIEKLLQVKAGKLSFSPEIWKRITVDTEGLRLAKPTSSLASTLTPRELEILKSVALGMTRKQIAATLHISVRTVDNHTNNIMDKLKTHDRLELARYALREGLVEP